jgi:hypothetical protein
MSKRHVVVIAIALQRACAGSWRRLQITAAGVAVALVAAGCGGSTSTNNRTSATQSRLPSSTAGAHSGWTGMGAPLSAFETAHSPQTSPGACPQGGCYGNGVFPAYVGPGQCCEFVDVSTTGPPDNRVDGYTQAFPVGTSVALAMNVVRILMPSDTTTTAFFIHHDSTGHTCGLWNVQSPTLGKWFSTKKAGDPQGVLGIDLNTINTQRVFSAKNVTQAVIGTDAADHRTNC